MHCLYGKNAENICINVTYLKNVKNKINLYNSSRICFFSDKNPLNFIKMETIKSLCYPCSRGQKRKQKHVSTKLVRNNLSKLLKAFRAIRVGIRTEKWSTLN